MGASPFFIIHLAQTITVMKFRPCIDLHDGTVKQIVGSTLVDDKPGSLKTNFTSEKPSSWYAKLYRKDNLTGGHIIKLGPGNDQAAKEALAAWPGGDADWWWN